MCRILHLAGEKKRMKGKKKKERRIRGKKFLEADPTPFR